MKEITLTINGKQVVGKVGDTVLDVCQANGIDLPTLCHLKELSDVGACRMCVVEIEGERRPVPACTYLIRDKLTVQTHTPRLEKYRRQLLELIFTEHNHFCMFCEASGDCELQRLAYRYQMDNVRYPYTFPSLPVDTISDYLVVDHNRCILCGRCVRACEEVAGSSTLNFARRGWKTIVSADIEQPLGESQCFSCGTCLQACPTGAIFSKLSVYKGKREECQEIKTVCPSCGLGCEINVLVKDNNLVKIEAANLRGLICHLGRFELLRDTRTRVTSPLIRDKQAELEACSLKKAVEVVAKKINEMGDVKGQFAGVVSARLPNETLSTFATFIREVVGSKWLDTLDGDAYRAIMSGTSGFANSHDRGLDLECSVDEILNSDCILVAGADPEETNPVIASLVRRATKQKGARLIVIDPEKDTFALWTDLYLKPVAGSEEALIDGLAKLITERRSVPEKGKGKGLSGSRSDNDVAEVARTTGVEQDQLELAAAMCGQSERVLIIYGERLLKKNSPSVVTSLLSLADITGNHDADKLRIIFLKRRANSRGAWDMGLAVKGIREKRPKGLHLLLGDEELDKEQLNLLKEIDFLIVQASHHSPVTELADVVLPSLTWAEREGSGVAVDGRVLKLRRTIQAQTGLSDEAILKEIAGTLGRTLTSS